MQFTIKQERQDEITFTNNIDYLKDIAYAYEREVRQLEKMLSKVEALHMQKVKEREEYREQGRQEGRQEILALPLYKLLWKWIKKYI